MQYYYADMYLVGLPANAGIKHKAYKDVVFIPCTKEEKCLNLMLRKKCHIHLWQLLLKKTRKIHPT